MAEDTNQEMAELREFLIRECSEWDRRQVNIERYMIDFEIHIKAKIKKYRTKTEKITDIIERLYSRESVNNNAAKEHYYHKCKEKLDKLCPPIGAMFDIISTLHSRVQALEERNGRN